MAYALQTLKSDHRPGRKSVLLEVNNPIYQEARDILSRFAELEKSPEYIHTYRISPLSLWNAASAGLAAEVIADGLTQYSKYPLPENVAVDIREYIGRYGRVQLIRRNNDLLLTSDDIPLILELQRHKELKPFHLDDKHSHYAYTPDTRTACHNLLTILAEMPAATWINADTLLISLQDRHEDFLIPERSLIEGRRSYYYYGNTADLIGKMDQLEQTFVAQVMADFLFQMGLVELGFDATPTKPTAWSAFRLTPLGTAALGDVDTADAVTEPTPEATPVAFSSGEDSAMLTVATDYVSDEHEENKTGLYALEKVDLFNLLCIPPDTRNGNTNPDVYGTAMGYCVKRRAMLLVDPPAEWEANKETAAAAACGKRRPALFI